MPQETLILGLNPAWQRLFFLDKFTLGEVHRIAKVEEYASGKGINCGRVLRHLGGTPVLMHFLGADNGSRIFDELSADGSCVDSRTDENLYDHRERWGIDRVD